MVLKKGEKIRVRRTFVDPPKRATLSLDKQTIILDSINPLLHRTLLSAFIEKKEYGYVEPKREGTARGEAIGFSKAKYRAILCCLRKTKIKDTAKLIGVSYGLLRKWRTEEPFKNKLSSLQGEFGNVFCKFVLDHNVEQFTGKWRAIPAHRAAHLADVGSYSKDLKESIVGCLMHLRAITGQNYLKADDFYTIISIADGLHAVDADLGKQMKKLLVERVRVREAPAAIEELAKLISKLPKKDKKQALELLVPLEFLYKL